MTLCRSVPRLFSALLGAFAVAAGGCAGDDLSVGDGRDGPMDVATDSPVAPAAPQATAPSMVLSPGDQGAEVAALTGWLTQYGYFPSARLAGTLGWTPAVAHAPADPSRYDDTLADAVRAYQKNMGLPVTGSLDAGTLAMMQAPRCGHPDNVKPVLPAAVGAHNKIDIWSGWTKRNLTYRFTNYNFQSSLNPGVGAADIEREYRNMLDVWAGATPLRFSRVTGSADLEANFAPFTDTSVLGWTSGPPSGDQQYDDDRRWSVDGSVAANEFDFATVVLHELGHAIGLGHSDQGAAVMFPSVAAGATKRTLAADDISGVIQLYNDGFFYIPEATAAPEAGIASVARRTDHLDLFMVGDDGRVWSTWWHANEFWRPWFIVTNGYFPPGSPVTVVAREPEHLDLFVVGYDGRVWSTWWHNGAGWHDWFPIGTTVFPQKSRVAANARYSTHMDLAVVGYDGNAWSAYWDVNGGFSSWFSIGAPPGQLPTTAEVSMLSRNPDTLDFFAVGNDGQVWTKWWNLQTGWGWWYSIPGTTFPAGAPVKAVARMSDHLDLFATANDGRVVSSYWHAGQGWSGWFQLLAGSAAPGTPVHALSRGTDHLDAFVIGWDGGLWQSNWDASSGWKGWWRLGRSFESFPQKARIDAMWRYDGHFDMFVLDGNRHARSTYWDDASGWR